MTILALLLFVAQPVPASKPVHIDELLATARARIASSPKLAEGYNDLAIALVRRYRERGDPTFLKQAEDAVSQSLKLEPANFEGRKARVVIRLAEHREADALEEAMALNKQTPDDNPVYGFIADAQMALGNYDAAEKTIQRMIDLRQVNGPGLQRGATLRELIGFPDAAIDWWNSSLKLTSADDEEERAFLLTHMASVSRGIGKLDMADSYLQQALALEPSYPAALTERALVRLAQEKPAEAAADLRKRLGQAPDLESEYWLTLADPSTGSAFQKHAVAAGGDTSVWILYLADHGQAAEAVKAGKRAMAARHDVATADALAWALYRAGDATEARKQIEIALQPGIRNADFFYHAGMIAKATDHTAASKYFKNALETSSSSQHTPDVLQEMAKLPKTVPR